MIKIYRHFIPARTLLWMIFELSLLFLLINVVTRLAVDSKSAHLASREVLVLSLLLVITTAVSGLAAGLYREEVRASLRSWLATAAASTVLALFSGSLVILAFRAVSIRGDISLQYWAIVVPLLWPSCFVLTRVAATAAARHDLFKRRILLVGGGERAAEIERFVAERASAVKIVRRLATGRPEDGTAEPAVGLTPAEIKAAGIREVVVASDEKRGMPMQQLMQWKLAGISIIDHLTFWEREAGQVSLGGLQPAWFVFSEGCRRTLFGRMIKRGVDLAGSIGLLALTFPIVAAFAVLIRFETPGPTFYRQLRTGRHGVPFMLLKFRSMTDGAERGTPQWAVTGDPRVTRIGRIMRMLRIDELPQLVNVIRGDMSLIGPRPERPYFVEKLAESIPFYADRHCVRPGLTGWAQINYPYGASVDDARKKLAYDLYYVKNQSLLLDIYIMIATIRVILFQEGAR